MLVKIDDIAIYTGGGDFVTESNLLIEYLNDNNITDATKLHYSDPTQFSEVFAPLETWFNNVSINSFPFIIYTEIDDELKPSQYQKVILKGVDEVMNSNFINLYKLGRI